MGKKVSLRRICTIINQILQFCQTKYRPSQVSGEEHKRVYWLWLEACPVTCHNVPSCAKALSKRGSCSRNTQVLFISKLSLAMLASRSLHHSSGSLCQGSEELTSNLTTQFWCCPPLTLGKTVLSSWRNLSVFLPFSETGSLSLAHSCAQGDVCFPQQAETSALKTDLCLMLSILSSSVIHVVLSPGIHQRGHIKEFNCGRVFVLVVEIL